MNEYILNEICLRHNCIFQNEYLLYISSVHAKLKIEIKFKNNILKITKKF